ncbi:MAG: HIT family protein [Bacteroidales bacterium]|jgi:histidine triad (HIT) family protein|nr:HIT family protein [Bacteroidales bacterium]
MTIFSKIIAGEIPSYKVAEDENYYAFLDINPLAKGHTLVIPKKEVDYIFDLSDEDLAGLMTFAKKIAHALIKAYPAPKIGMSVIGLDVPHVHVHLVPLHDNASMNFAKEKLKLSAQEFQEIVSNIVANL